MGPGGPRVDVLRVDAASGTAERLAELAGIPSAAVLTGNRIWISGEQRDGPTEDPVTTLCCLGTDGREITAVELPGQIDAIAAGDRRVWVAGFRPTRQAHILTVLDPGGAVTGEVSFRDLDLTPWAPPAPAPAARLPMPERARAIRDAVAACLTGPVQMHGRFGDQWEAPAVSAEFQLDRVELHGSGDDYEIAVLFRWSGEEDLFGMRYGVPPAEDEDYDVPDAYISVYVEENLLAVGYGLENAIREPADGITWLRWT
jgi:hypothetical protein